MVLTAGGHIEVALMARCPLLSVLMRGQGLVSRCPRQGAKARYSLQGAKARCSRQGAKCKVIIAGTHCKVVMATWGCCIGRHTLPHLLLPDYEHLLAALMKPVAPPPKRAATPSKDEDKEEKKGGGGLLGFLGLGGKPKQVEDAPPAKGTSK
eukprot:scaffold103427_cov21-Tisochrysis_lutea.AAC.1